jgi:hypothetical protein
MISFALPFAMLTLGAARSIAVAVGPDEAPVIETFLEALKIQLAGAEIEVAPPFASGLRGETRASLLAFMKTRGASLVVSIETDRERQELGAYAMAEVLGAVVELGRFSRTRSIDHDRALAIKVRELADVAGMVHEPVTIAATPSASASPVIERGPPFRPLVELGTFAGASSSVPRGSIGAALAAGIGIAFGGSRLEPFAVLRLPLSARSSTLDGVVSTQETDLALGARFLADLGTSFCVGIAAEGGVRRLNATGTASDGRTGAAQTVIPTIATTAVGGWHWTTWLDLRAQGGIEVSPIQQQFAVAGVTIQDFGRVRATAQLSLVLTSP